MEYILLTISENPFLMFLVIVGFIVLIILVFKWIIALIKNIIRQVYLQPQRRDMELLARQKSEGFPWLADAYSEYFYLCDLKTADYLEIKKHPARKSAEKVRKIAAQRKIAERLYRILQYKLEYYEKMFPWLVDYRDEGIDDLIRQTKGGMQKSGEDIEEPEDAVVIYTTEGERASVSKRKLSRQELFQRALDRYWQKKKNNWGIGRDYERYIGYLYEKRGYSVYYQGIVEGFEDLGRDLVVIKGNDIEIVQCKYWSQKKPIHEKHIFQLFGTTVEYWVKNVAKQNTSQPSQFPELLRQDRIKPTFITSTKLSEKAREFSIETLPMYKVQYLYAQRREDLPSSF